jgi:hypothetical protein
MNNDLASLTREVAGIRLILAHLLAHLSYKDLRTISENISQDLSKPGQGLAASADENEKERWAAPYRRVIDQILAQGETLRGRRGSGGQARSRKDP